MDIFQYPALISHFVVRFTRVVQKESRVQKNSLLQYSLSVGYWSCCPKPSRTSRKMLRRRCPAFVVFLCHRSYYIQARRSAGGKDGKSPLLKEFRRSTTLGYAVRLLCFLGVTVGSHVAPFLFCVTVTVDKKLARLTSHSATIARRC